MKFKKFSPLNGELVKEYEYSSLENVSNTIAMLQQSFRNWKNLEVSKRQEILKPVAFRLRERKKLFAESISNEMAKPYAQSLAEVDKCIATIEACVQMDLSFLKPTTLNSVYQSSQILIEPLGVIYSIMPWNFPLWQSIRMILPGLLSGNVILLKHSEVTPEMGVLIEDLFSNLFESPVLKHHHIEHSNTDAILADSQVRGVSITGSTKAGLAIASIAAKYLKKYVLELGGSDPYLVFPNADLKLAAKIIAQSRLQNTGQSCIAGKRCLIHDTILAEMLELLKKEFANYSFGLPYESGVKLGPLADHRFKLALAEQIEKFQTATNAEKVFQLRAPVDSKAAFVDAEIYLLKENSDWLQAQEFFAPVLMLIPFKDEAEAIKIANSTVFGLGAAIFSQDLLQARRIASALEAGQVVINDFIKSDVSLPFGGIKMSGVGRELGRSGFLEFTEIKVISNS